MTTRRDDNRPVNGFQGRTVHIWGCGGLGSWLAEFIARAGASTITGGLLVRQNYTEADIGQAKADALATRLRAIRDDLSVTVAEGSVPYSWLSRPGPHHRRHRQSQHHHYLDSLAGEDRTALITQVATDARTGSLGIVNICAPGAPCAPSELDDQAGRSVLADCRLELYHRLWEDAAEGDEGSHEGMLRTHVPRLGCGPRCRRRDTRQHDRPAPPTGRGTCFGDPPDRPATRTSRPTASLPSRGVGLPRMR